MERVPGRHRGGQQASRRWLTREIAAVQTEIDFLTFFDPPAESEAERAPAKIVKVLIYVVTAAIAYAAELARARVVLTSASFICGLNRG
jgi:hypothetical protein